jgi:hypothetical protein
LFGRELSEIRPLGASSNQVRAFREFEAPSEKESPTVYRSTLFSLKRRAVLMFFLIFSAMVAAERVVEGLNDCVVYPGPHLLDGVIRTVGPGAIGQQSDRELLLGINP